MKQRIEGFCNDIDSWRIELVEDYASTITVV